MKEAHFKMRNNGESDVYRLNDPGSLISYKQKEAIFLGVDGCSERASELSMPGYRTLYFQLSHFYVHFYYIALVL